ncbi:glycosyltransferase [Bacillus sp. SL00103]
MLNRFIHEFDMMSEEQMREALFVAIESHDLLSEQMTREGKRLPMKKKVLFCATVDYHFQAFHLPYFRWFQEQGWEVHTAANGQLELPYVDQTHSIPIQRSPFHVHNRLAYVELKKLLAKEHYDFIHCHTPMGSGLADLQPKARAKKGRRYFTQPMVFTFLQGAPLQNWLLYYPIERWLARHTDALITINGEDFKRADRLSKERASVYYVPGMGVDMKRFAPVNEKEKRLSSCSPWLFFRRFYCAVRWN